MALRACLPGGPAEVRVEHYAGSVDDFTKRGREVPSDGFVDCVRGHRRGAPPLLDFYSPLVQQAAKDRGDDLASVLLNDRSERLGVEHGADRWQRFVGVFVHGHAREV